MIIQYNRIGRRQRIQNFGYEYDGDPMYGEDGGLGPDEDPIETRVSSRSGRVGNDTLIETQWGPDVWKDWAAGLMYGVWAEWRRGWSIGVPLPRPGFTMWTTSGPCRCCAPGLIWQLVVVYQLHGAYYLDASTRSAG